MNLIENMSSNRAYLYHGTTLNAVIEILRDGYVRSSSQYAHNPVGVSLTRDYRIALEFGRYWEREFNVVLVFDQEAIIRSNLKLSSRRDSCEKGNYRPSEAEEMVIGDLPLDRYLVSINIPEQEFARALGKTGQEYVEYLHGEGWDLEWEDWKNGVETLARHPLLNAVLHRAEDYHREQINKSYGYWIAESLAPTPKGTIPERAYHEFKHGACMSLAIAIHDATGWPIYAVTDAHNVYDGRAGGGSAMHWVVAHPSGKFLDIEGLHTKDELEDEYQYYADDEEAVVALSSRTDAMEWLEESGCEISVDNSAKFVDILLSQI